MSARLSSILLILVAAFGWSVRARAQPLVIESVTPAAVEAGAAGVALTVTGTGFLSELEPLIELRWDSLDQPLPTARVSATTLTAQVPASLLVLPGDHRIFAVRSCAAPGCQGFTLSNPLTFTVESQPGLQVAPDRLNFSHAPGAPPPAPQQVSVTGPGVGSFSVEVATTGGGDWLSAAPGSGPLPATVQVAVDPSSLGAGVYRGSVLLIPAGGGSPATVAVTLTVGSEPNLAFNPPKVEFTIVDGQPQPPSVEVAVSGPQGLPFEVVSAPAWLEVEPMAGAAPATLTVRIRPEALPPGNQTGLITVSAEGLASPRILEVTVRAGGAPPLSVSPSQLSFAFVQGETPPAQTLSVSAGGAAAPFAIAPTQPWLEATPTTGQTPATITVRIGPQLDPGEYAGELVISSDGSPSLRTPVTVTVAPAPPPSLQLTGLGGELQPAEQPRVRVTLDSPAAAAVEGFLRAEFSPEAPVPEGQDPLVTFADGSTEVRFRIPAGETAAEYALQIGTTAGSLRLTAAADGGETAELTSRLPSLPPVIESARLEGSANNLQLTVVGYATSRDISRVRLTFEPALGAELDAPPADVGGAEAAFDAWFSRPESRLHGGTFRLAVPLEIQGDPAALGAVGVRLSNDQGQSPEARAPR